MNYFAHARHFLDDPHFAVGTAVPDWLTVADRRVRLRAVQVRPWTADGEPRVAAFARGVLQHFADDARFHESRAFAETSLALTVAARDALGGESGMRPAFLGHLLVETLLDAALIAESPETLEEYYRAVAAIDGAWVQAVVNRMTPRPTERLAYLADLFVAERFLSDYATDAGLLKRLNQVMRRVKLPELPPRLMAILPAARDLVASRRRDLLHGTPVECAVSAAPAARG